jgi:RNA polymerase sigma factor (sigma-70 family)
VQGASLDDLIVEAQEADDDDSAAMNEIIGRFDTLAVQIGRGLTVDPSLQDVLANTARIELVKVVRRHDRGKAGFPAYAKVAMKFAALREWKRTRRRGEHETTVDFQDPESEHLMIAENVDEPSPWGNGRMAEIISTLKPAQQALLDWRYVDAETLKNIGDETGSTASAVYQRLGTVHRAVQQALAA